MAELDRRYSEQRRWIEERAAWYAPAERIEWMYVREFLFPYFDWLKTADGEAWKRSVSPALMKTA